MSKKKLIDVIKTKSAELKKQNIVPSSLLTEEKMKSWILDENKTRNDICRITGCHSQVVRDRANELGLATIPKKQQMAIAKNIGKL